MKTSTEYVARSNSVFRWAGSKRKLLPVLTKHAPQQFETYIEPFVGSACLFFELTPERAILGDINECLVRSYKLIRRSPSELHQLLSALPRRKSFYYELRDVPEDVLSPTEQITRFVYLNRYSFNGVYRTNKSGQFNVPRGIRTGGIPPEQHFLSCSQALQRAELVNADFELVMEMAGSGDFLYLDPPYRPSEVRHRGEYGYDSFSKDDFKRLQSAMRRASRRNVQVLLSFFDCPAVRDAFPNWRVTLAKTKRHVAGFACNRTTVNEVLIRNY